MTHTATHVLAEWDASAKRFEQMAANTRKLAVTVAGIEADAKVVAYESSPEAQVKTLKRAEKTGWTITNVYPEYVLLRYRTTSNKMRVYLNGSFKKN